MRKNYGTFSGKLSLRDFIPPIRMLSFSHQKFYIDITAPPEETAPNKNTRKTHLNIIFQIPKPLNLILSCISNTN